MIFPDGAEGLLAPYLEGDTNMKLDGISLPKRFWPETESKFHDVTARREDKYWFVRIDINRSLSGNVTPPFCDVLPYEINYENHFLLIGFICT